MDTQKRHHGLHIMEQLRNNLYPIVCVTDTNIIMTDPECICLLMPMMTRMPMNFIQNIILDVKHSEFAREIPATAHGIIKCQNSMCIDLHVLHMMGLKISINCTWTESKLIVEHLLEMILLLLSDPEA